MELKTNRLYLRYFTMEDTDAVYAYSQNLNVALAAAWAPHPSPEYTRTVVEKFIRNREIAIVWRESGTVIGSIGVFAPVKKDYTGMEISFSLKEEFWGRGIMKEALNSAIPYIFNEYRCDRIYCCCFLDNVRSAAVAEGLGFTYLEEYLYGDTPDGIARPVRYYELSRSDFYGFVFDFTAEEYMRMRKRVGWPAVSLSQAEELCRNSDFKIAVLHEHTMIGMARCIADNALLYLICDVMVAPENQGKGIGRRMLRQLIHNIRRKIGTATARIYVMSLKGKEGFYKSLGFSEDYATGLTVVWEGEENGNGRKEN